MGRAERGVWRGVLGRQGGTGRGGIKGGGGGVGSEGQEGEGGRSKMEQEGEWRHGEE